MRNSNELPDILQKLNKEKTLFYKHGVIISVLVHGFFVKEETRLFATSCSSSNESGGGVCPYAAAGHLCCA